MLTFLPFIIILTSPAAVEFRLRTASIPLHNSNIRPTTPVELKHWPMNDNLVVNQLFDSSRRLPTLQSR